MFQKKQSLIYDKENLLQRLEANDPHVTIAVFDTYPLVHADVVRLVNILNSNPHLLSLKVLDCRLRADDVKAIFNAILNNTTIREFKVEIFEDDDSLKSLMDIVKSHLQNNHISRTSCK